MITWEIKKIFASKSGIIALILFIILSISMVFIKPKLGGEIGNNLDSITVEEQYRIKVGELKEASKSEETDEFSTDMKELASKKLDAMKFKEYKEVTFWQVFNHRSTHGFMIFIMLIIIAIIFPNIYTDEIISGVDSLILSSKNKYRALYSKLALSIGIPTILYFGHLMVQFIVTYIQYGKPINGDLQAIRIVDIPLLLKDAYTIHEFLLLKTGILLMVFITLGVIASLASFVTKSSIQSISGFLIFIFLGKIITLIKFLPKSVLLIFSKANYIDMLSNFNKSALMYTGKVSILSMNLDATNLYLAVLAITIVIGIILCIRTFKRFLTK